MFCTDALKNAGLLLKVRQWIGVKATARIAMRQIARLRLFPRVLPLPVLTVGCPPSFQYGDERRNSLSNVRGRCVCAWGTTYPVSTVGQESVEQVEMAPAIMIVMLAAAGINILLFRASPAAAVKGSIMNASMVALISIAGLGWLGSSFFEGNRHFIINSISSVVQQHTSVFAVGLFALSILLASQAVTVVTLMPVGIAL